MKLANPVLPEISSHRSGYVMVLFVLALVILLGFGALVIDLGFARLTQAQMNSAVDTAALEGLRLRDEIPDPERRQAASDMVAMVFDDDLDPTNGDAFNFGAGPLMNFSDGIALPDTDFRAAETMSIPGVPVYDPVLQINSANDPAGDMVAGNYNPTSSHIEQSDYSRADFDPVAGTNAFLVRMRRTNEAIDPSFGIGSNAMPIPFLFGRGTVAGSAAKANGIPVRSTAIADAQPAMSVGAAIRGASLEIPGVLPFALRRSQWNALSDGTATLATVSATGIVSLFSVTVDPATQGEGFVVLADGSPAAMTFGDSASIDIPAEPATFVVQMIANAAQPASGLTSGYVPIAGDLSSSVADYVVGFGYVDTLTDAGSGTFQLTKRGDRIAASNVAAIVMTSPDPAIVDGLFAERSFVNGKVATPVLVR